MFSELVIDGTTYKLAYSFGAIAAAERIAGCNLLAALGSLSDLTAAQFLGLFYAALSVAHRKTGKGGRDEGPCFSLAQVERLIRFDTMQLIEEKMAEAYRLSMPATDKADPIEAGSAQPAKG